MAAELQVNYTSGSVVYAHVRSAVGTIWNGSALESYVTANIANYKIACTEQGSASGYYTATFPGAVAGVYAVTYKQQMGGSPAESDPTIAVELFHWDGTVHVAESSLATSGQVGQFLPMRMARGVAVSGFVFKLVSSSDHVTNFTSGVISGQISRDGGSFGALQSGLTIGAYTEIGNGWYRCNLTSGDLAATTVALLFTGAGISGGTCDQRDFGFVLQRTSGQTIT